MSNHRRIQISESNDITIVRFVDRKILDPANIQELGQELFRLVDKDQRPKIVLNFSDVEFLSSEALGKLITMDKKARQHGTQIILTNIRPEIYEIFRITNLNRVLEIKDDEADALAVF